MVIDEQGIIKSLRMIEVDNDFSNLEELIEYARELAIYKWLDAIKGFEVHGFKTEEFLKIFRSKLGKIELVEHLSKSEDTTIYSTGVTNNPNPDPDIDLPLYYIQCTMKSAKKSNNSTFPNDIQLFDILEVKLVEEQIEDEDIVDKFFQGEDLRKLIPTIDVETYRGVFASLIIKLIFYAFQVEMTSLLRIEGCSNKINRETFETKEIGSYQASNVMRVLESFRPRPRIESFYDCLFSSEDNYHKLNEFDKYTLDLLNILEF